MTTAIRIEDRLALQDLLAAYSWALDTGDVEGLVACFTPDTRMVEEVFEEPDIWVGHEGIRKLAQHYFNAPGFPGRQHHVTQVQYFPQDVDTVAMRAFAFVTECKGEPPYLLDSRGGTRMLPFVATTSAGDSSHAPSGCGTVRCSRTFRATGSGCRASGRTR